MGDFNIRELTSADIDILNKFWEKLSSSDKSISKLYDLKSDLSIMKKELLSSKSGSVILGNIDEADENLLRGIASLDLLDYVRGWLTFLVVLPQYRKKGIGNELIKKSESIFKQNGKYIFRAPTPKFFISVRALLEKNGYQQLRIGQSGFVMYEKRIKQS